MKQIITPNVITKVAFNSSDPHEVRQAARAGILDGPTTTLAAGHVQANIVILPADFASDFLLFCQRNPKPCPLIAMSDVGSPRLLKLGEDLDLRTDLPRYRVFRDGKMVEDRADISELWQDNFVGFALGCSLSFESSLGETGLSQAYLEQGRVVPTYVTNIDCEPGGCFSGKLVVSMRQFSAQDAIRAIQVTSRFPNVHGAPIHIGDPSTIGINDLAVPYFGTAPAMKNDQLPLFWACGVTPQIALEKARPPISITHTPAHMLVTDLRNASLSSF
tara:strand:- start:1321 stop:2145 length:825 start_codon:yes stop_codon:yes gene_type:complete